MGSTPTRPIRRLSGLLFCNSNHLRFRFGRRSVGLQSTLRGGTTATLIQIASKLSLSNTQNDGKLLHKWGGEAATKGSADATDLKSVGGDTVWVRPPPALQETFTGLFFILLEFHPLARTHRRSPLPSNEKRPVNSGLFYICFFLQLLVEIRTQSSETRLVRAPKSILIFPLIHWFTSLNKLTASSCAAACSLSA